MNFWKINPEKNQDSEQRSSNNKFKEWESHEVEKVCW